MKTTIGILVMLGLFLTMPLSTHADDSTTQQVKENTQTAGDKVDTTAHTAVRKVKSQARKTKTAVQNSTDDNPVRKTARKAKDSGNDALDKVDDTVHGH